MALRTPVPATPALLAATVVPTAASHCLGLRDRTAETGGDDDAAWNRVLQELFLAHYCLASLRVIQYFQDEELRNWFGFQMLELLRHYPDEHSNLVRDTFADTELVNDAIRCYVQGNLTTAERERIDFLRRIGAIEKDSKGLVLFCARLQTRTTGLLGVDAHSPGHMVLWLQHLSAVTSAWKTLYSQFGLVAGDTEQRTPQRGSGFLGWLRGRFRN
ncbi:MAG: hypothetical protein WA188_05720 [Terriglobales bacterium]